METHITDEHGNVATVAYWGSIEAARASLATLWNCTGCTDCTGCTRCTDCTCCTYCTRCTRCTDAKIIGPFRSDGFQFVMSAAGSVHAGCRAFATMADARGHWSRTRGGTPLGDETMRILDWLEAEFAARGRAPS